MNNLLKKLENFFKQNSPAIIVNTSTNWALLCLKPQVQIHDDKIFLRFESLNGRGGNSVFLKAVRGEEPDTLYLENEEENILMLQKLNLANYRGYIKPQYFNAPEISNEKEIIKHISKNYVEA